MVDLETYQKVAMYQCMAKSRWLGHLQCIFVKKSQYFQFSGSFFYKNIDISWTTTRDRKLKFGMNDPYNMFFKIGYPFGDILFRFYTKWIFVSLLPKYGWKTLFWGHFGVTARQKSTLLKNEKRYHQMDAQF